MANPVNTSVDNTPLVIKNEGQPPFSYTVLTGAVVAAGSVMGIITASGKLLLSDDAAVDGSENAQFVLTEAVDASGGDVTGVRNKLLAAGIVNSDKLVFGGGDVIADRYIELKGIGILAVNPDLSEALDNT